MIDHLRSFNWCPDLACLLESTHAFTPPNPADRVSAAVPECAVVAEYVARDIGVALAAHARAEWSLRS